MRGGDLGKVQAGGAFEKVAGFPDAALKERVRLGVVRGGSGRNDGCHHGGGGRGRDWRRNRRGGDDGRRSYDNGWRGRDGGRRRRCGRNGNGRRGWSNGRRSGGEREQFKQRRERGCRFGRFGGFGGGIGFGWRVPFTEVTALLGGVGGGVKWL